MMLQSNLLNQPEESRLDSEGQRLTMDKMQLQHQQHQQQAQAQEDKEDDEVLAREQIKRMMNKLQEMQLKHQQKQELPQVSPIKSGAINVSYRRQNNLRSPQDGKEIIRIGGQEDTTSTVMSHELIKRRFFEKLERRKSTGNSMTSSAGTPMTMRRNQFTSQLSNLREENEYGSNCEILVSDEQQTNTNKSQDCSSSNSQLFVCCESAQISTNERKADDGDGDDAGGAEADITCKLKNDNALTGTGDEAVYLTMDWKNVQVNGHHHHRHHNDNHHEMAYREQCNTNREQSEEISVGSRSQVEEAKQNDLAVQQKLLDLQAVEQKQIKPLAAENNKPPVGEEEAEEPPDTFGEYKHPIPVGQRHQQQQQQVSSESQVLVGSWNRQRVNEADLVILPKKSVNSKTQRGIINLMGMRKNSSIRHLMQPTRAAKEDESSARLSPGPLRQSRRRRRRSRSPVPRCDRRTRSSCSQSSVSSLDSSSSSSSGLSSSPSSSSSVCSLDHDEQRVPALVRLEQLSLSEDDLKSLISHSDSCRCCECSTSNGLAKSAQRQSKRRADCNSPDSIKKDDSSNSSSGNSSATRSLMNSLFHRGHKSSRKNSSSNPTETATATAKSVPNLIVESHSLMANSLPANEKRKPSDSSGRFWSLFAGSPIGLSHANTSAPQADEQSRRMPTKTGSRLLPTKQVGCQYVEREKQTSDDRDSSHIYSSPHWQPKTAGYRLHLPVAPAASQPVHPKPPAHLQQAAYASLTNARYHSCARHSHHHSRSQSQSHHHHNHHHQHQHHHHRKHRLHQNHSHYHRHHDHSEPSRRSSSASRHAHVPSTCYTQDYSVSGRTKLAPARDKRREEVWGQLIEINKLDGSQVVELERQAGSSWGFFLARGAINKTKGIFISRTQDTQPQTGSDRTSPLAGLLGVGDHLLAIDEHQIGPDYDILRVNRLISKKNKILLKIKPFKG